MRAQLLARSLFVVSALACASAHPRTRIGEGSGSSEAAQPVYEQYGVIALPLGAAGRFYFLAGATPDTTKVLFLAAAVPDDGLDLDLTRGGAIVHRFHMDSGQFQEATRLAPGVYDLTSGRYAQSVVVPRFERTSLAQPIPMQSTWIIGRDMAVDVYVEAYGTSDAPVTLSAPGWSDTVTFRRNGNVSFASVLVPVSRFVPGATTLVLARGHETAKSLVLAGFVSPVPGSFDRAIDVLRYLAPRERLDSLRHTQPEERPQAWASFMAQYGPRLPEYDLRLSLANKRYTEMDTPGWQTDRGSVYLQLGDPDQVFVEPGFNVWVYTRYFGRLKFRHESQRWRLTPESHAMLDTLLVRSRDAR